MLTTEGRVQHHLFNQDTKTDIDTFQFRDDFSHF